MLTNSRSSAKPATLDIDRLCAVVFCRGNRRFRIDSISCESAAKRIASRINRDPHNQAKDFRAVTVPVEVRLVG